MNGKMELRYFTHCLSQLANSSHNDQVALLAAIEAAITLLEARNRHTPGHSSEVAFIAFFIARHLGLSFQEQVRVKLAALVHDIGKVKSEEYPGEHALLGARIIRCVPQLDGIADMVLFHHARWQDATPFGLTPNAAIPLGARIIAVADAFQRSLSNRSGCNVVAKSSIVGGLRRREGLGLAPFIVDIIDENYDLLSRFVGMYPPIGPTIWKIYD